MTDFTLEPDDLDAPGPPRRPQAPRLVTMGLHPTAAVPKARTKDLPPAYTPCAACGQPVLTGQTRAGACLVLDVSVQTYCVLWSPGEAMVEREDRRQSSPYEGDLEKWLDHTKATVVWWERLALEYLELPREKWSDRRQQMSLAQALFALGWRKGKRERIKHVGLVVPWRKPGEGEV